MPDVRTTLEPDKVLVVDEREAYGLRQQGLLLEESVDKAPDQDPSAPGDTHVDADTARDETNQARREALGEDRDQNDANKQVQRRQRADARTGKDDRS